MNPIIEELRREARINEVCGSPEWTALLDRAANQIAQHAQSRRRLKQFMQNKVSEVLNGNGGVVGYTLTLNANETEQLWAEIER